MAAFYFLSHVFVYCCSLLTCSYLTFSPSSSGFYGRDLRLSGPSRALGSVASWLLRGLLISPWLLGFLVAFWLHDGLLTSQCLLRFFLPTGRLIPYWFPDFLVVC